MFSLTIDIYAHYKKKWKTKKMKKESVTQHIGCRHYSTYEWINQSIKSYLYGTMWGKWTRGVRIIKFNAQYHSGKASSKAILKVTALFTKCWLSEDCHWSTTSQICCFRPSHLFITTIYHVVQYLWWGGIFCYGCAGKLIDGKWIQAVKSTTTFSQYISAEWPSLE